jgi:hypothetical protein
MSTELEATNTTPVLCEDQIIAWQCTTYAPIIKSAGTDRKWMDDASQKFPYRCLPIVIANSFGWDVLNPVTFSATWTGGAEPDAVKLYWPGNKSCPVPQAHFGAGVLTFTLGHLFQTPPGVNLFIKGPPNEPKDGIIPLEGIVETDWCPATFTMNWLFTRKNHQVIFQAGESFCRFFPIPRYVTEAIQPEIRSLQNNPQLQKLHNDWRAKRDEFNKGLKIPDSEYAKRKWQKEYFQGGGIGEWDRFKEHQTKLHQKEFIDKRDPNIKEQDYLPESQSRPVNINLHGKSFQIQLVDESSGGNKCPYRDGK